MNKFANEIGNVYYDSFLSPIRLELGHGRTSKFSVHLMTSSVAEWIFSKAPVYFITGHSFTIFTVERYDRVSVMNDWQS